MLFLRRLHKNILRDAQRHLDQGGYLTHISNQLVSVGCYPNDQFTIYTPPKSYMRAIFFPINLDQNAPIGRFYIGSEPGYGTGKTAVEKDKTKRTLEKNQATFRGYLKMSDIRGFELSDPEVFFHSSQVPKDLPKLELSERERQILFCFTLKNNYLRKEALSSLSVHHQEIERLISSGLLKGYRSGAELTPIAEVNRSTSLEAISKDLW
jgi:hypothetical protein